MADIDRWTTDYHLLFHCIFVDFHKKFRDQFIGPFFSSATTCRAAASTSAIPSIFFTSSPINRMIQYAIPLSIVKVTSTVPNHASLISAFLYTLECEPTGIIIFWIWQYGVPTRVPACGATSVRLLLMNTIRSSLPDILVLRENRWIAQNSIRAGEEIIISRPGPTTSGVGAFMRR